ncbi:MAG: RNA polymerase sigma factor [Psychrobacillus sp.]
MKNVQLSIEKKSHSKIFKLYYKRVYRRAFIILKNHDSAQDVLQETFIKSFKKINSIQNIEKIGAWLEAITTKTAIDYIRKTNKMNEIIKKKNIENRIILDDIKSFSVVEKVMEEKFIERYLHEEINKLKPKDKEVLILHYFNDMKYVEIACALDINLSSVKVQIHRAKIRLKESLENQPELMESMLNREL